MSYFQQIQKWLRKSGIDSKRANPLTPIEHKVIKRSKEFTDSYHKWLIGGHKDHFISDLNGKLIKSMLGEATVLELTVLDSVGAKGFSIDLTDDNNSSQWEYLLDYLCAQVKDLGYTCYNSDVRLYERNFGIESIFRQYLKPRIRHSDQLPVSQKYGNILIEYSLKNDEPHQFKFLSTQYSDSKFQDPLPYNDLLYQILK